VVWPCFSSAARVSRFLATVSLYTTMSMLSGQHSHTKSPSLPPSTKCHYHDRNNAVDYRHVPTKTGSPLSASETWISSLVCEPWVSLLAAGGSPFLWAQPSAHLLHGSPVENMQPILLHAEEKSPHQFSINAPSIIKPISTKGPCLHGRSPTGMLSPLFSNRLTAFRYFAN
jgi:hypothetical protein